MSFHPSEKFTAVISAIDAVNAEDPRRISVDGAERPYETVYAERMSETLEAIYPDASELLRIAARAQHVRRWEIPRDTHPKTREGYQKWRLSLRKLHGEIVTKIMTENGYDAEDASLVAAYLRKEKLKKAADSQALENVVDVVFLNYYWDEFVGRYPHYDDDKLIDIVGKTLRKMSSTGHAAALALDLPEKTVAIVMAAVEREKETLARLAEHEVS